MASTDRPGTGEADGRHPGRRRVLAGAGAALVAMPFIRRAAASERSLKISTFGGNFEDCFVKYIYPEFEKATGIKVESVSQSSGLEFMVQIAEATKAGTATIDLCTASQQDVRRGAQDKLWHPFDTQRIGNLGNLAAGYVHTGETGVDAIGAMAWYQTLIVNPRIFPVPPTSWKVLWDPAHRNAWGLSSGGNSSLFEITAATWFGGIGVLDSEDGIRQVVAKIAELKPNVKVWWESEGTMQTAYENDEVIGGMYYHDVAGVMQRGGTPVLSVFPAEGGVIDFGSWCQPVASTRTAEAEAFINFTCTPAIQALMTRKNGTAPLVERALTGLTDAEFAAAASETRPIPIAVDARMRHLGFMDAEFTRMLTS